MLYEVFQPPADLAPYVRFYWALEAEVNEGEFVHRSMADGCVEIVFHYRATFDEVGRNGEHLGSPVSSIQAQSTRFRRFSTRESFGIFGAYLYPFAIPRLFSYPASDFTNISPDLADVFGPAGREIEERILVARDAGARVRIISEFLRSMLSRSARELPSLYRAVGAILDAGGDVRVSDLARDNQLSIRQFERRFKELAGLSPKLYARVTRFQHAAQRKLIGVKDLTELAHECGYYDQSHFINDFRQFSGYTPKEYFWTPAEGTQYMSA